ncbi:MAG: glycosyl transferase [Xanthobacteraceae bacterium]|jgi:UDP-N-acetylmuramyl pentapeptide phosphotransferase/UDP-N-acetylglucosamine-1-phosphate transferase
MLVAFGTATAACSAIVCAGLIVLIRPWLQRYALARPNARSSHQVPTPQGGGIAVVAATIAVAYASPLFATDFIPPGATSAAPPVVLLAAIIVMAGVGAVADVRPIDVAPRLLLQMLAVAAVIFALPADLHIVPIIPWWAERVLLVIGGLWFVNLVNFMDGLDWMTVAEVVPLTAALAAIGWLGVLPPQAVGMSLCLCGAMVGFGFFNRPVAKLFLGDVGSLPIGLVLGWLLVVLAGHGGRAAALLLPLYYLADSTITLLRRLGAGEQIWQAHRTHFYQRATDRGFTVIDVVGRVFAINILLAALALLTVLWPGRMTDIAALIAGAGAVIWLLFAFGRGRG